MRVQIITKLNGWGLSTDVQVLREALVLAGLRPEDIAVADWQRPVSGASFDINFHLELVNPAFLVQARRNVMIPNPEWFMTSWLGVLPRFAEVWAKTRDGQEIFSQHHGNTRFVGWTSPDRMDIAVNGTAGRVLHVAGGSSAKGTAQVAKAAQRMAIPVTVVGQSEHIPNIPEFNRLGRVDDQTLTRVMNEHPIHLCPSSYEGFGHYINEARSVGALIVTTNAPPLNELVQPHFGIGAALGSTFRQQLATHSVVDVDSLISAIDHARKAPPEAVAIIGARARAAYLDGRAEFHRNLSALL